MSVSVTWAPSFFYVTRRAPQSSDIFRNALGCEPRERRTCTNTRFMNINYGINEPRTTKPSGRWTLDVNRFKTWWVLSFRRKNLPAIQKETFVPSRLDLNAASRRLLTLLCKSALSSDFWMFFKRKKHKILQRAEKEEKSSNKPQEKSKSPLASLLHLNLGLSPVSQSQLNY